MRIDELKKVAEENDYTLWSISGDFYQFKRKLTMKLIHIGKLEVNRIYFHNFDICDEKDFNMIKACMDFSYTPPEDRQEIKKYFYKHNFIQTKGNSFTYLAIRQRPSISYPVLQGSSEDIFEYKVEFTDDEIEKAKKEHGIFLDDFEKIEVKGDQK